jgi:hypothetical protein
VFEEAGQAPPDAVVLLRATHWATQLVTCLRHGFTRFAVPPRRNLTSGERTVIASRAHRVVFVPNYKVMYSSFREFMRERFPEFAGAPASTYGLNRQLDLHARTASRYFRFSMVRNPWDRLASAYRDKMGRGPDHKNQETFVAPLAAVMQRQEADFETFVRFCEDVPDSHCDPHWLGCHANLHDGSTCLVDFTGRIEQAREDLETLKKKTGVVWDLPVLNRTRGPGVAYRDFYTSDDLIERVGRRFHADVTGYGYTF